MTMQLTGGVGSDRFTVTNPTGPVAAYLATLPDLGASTDPGPLPGETVASNSGGRVDTGSEIPNVGAEFKFMDGATQCVSFASMQVIKKLAFG